MGLRAIFCFHFLRASSVRNVHRTDDCDDSEASCVIASEAISLISDNHLLVKRTPAVSHTRELACLVTTGKPALAVRFVS